MAVGGREKRRRGEVVWEEKKESNGEE